MKMKLTLAAITLATIACATVVLGEEDCGMIVYSDTDCGNEIHFASIGDDGCHTKELKEPGEAEAYKEEAFHFDDPPFITVWSMSLECPRDGGGMYVVDYDGICRTVRDDHEMWIDSLRAISFKMDCKKVLE